MSMPSTNSMVWTALIALAVVVVAFRVDFIRNNAVGVK